MHRLRRRLSALRAPGAAALAAATLLVVGCAGRVGLEPVTLASSGKDLALLVDSQPAQRLLADLLARRSPDLRLAALAATVPSDLVEGRADPLPGVDLPDQARLRELAQKVSVDFAALAFAHALGADERSRAVQAAFDRFLHEDRARAEEVLQGPGAFPYTVLFAPSWLHRSYPKNGADFARQRRLLDRLGITNRLIETAESGSVEDNAAVIAAAVRETAPAKRALILVSASKSGAEVALALSRLLAPGEMAGVAGWINVAGALGGTPLADSALRPPASWVTRLVFWLNGWNRDGLISMATGPSHQRLEDARLPDTITVINLVAVPVSGSVGLKVVLGYKSLLAHGPNDGVVLLADTVWPGGANIVALGSDHLFTAQQGDAHALALMRALDFAVRRDGCPGPRSGFGCGR